MVYNGISIYVRVSIGLLLFFYTISCICMQRDLMKIHMYFT